MLASQRAASMLRFITLLRRFGRDERGAFVALFAVIGIVLIATAGAVVDYTSVEQARTRAQVALDAATLALQPSIYTQNTSWLQTKAQAVLTERINDSRISATIQTVTKDTSTGTLFMTADISVPMSFVALVGITQMEATIESKAVRGSVNLEVAVALDVTGSMSGTKIQGLRDATEDLIDLVVQDTQTPTYTKMALVPYSMGVNVGISYAASIRGPVTQPAITGATWLATTTSTITAITKASPARITTSAAHGLSTGNIVYISGINDNGFNSFADNLNNRYFTITVVNSTRFTLNGVNSSSYTTYGSGGNTRACLTNSCEIVITSASHPFSAGNSVTISGVGGMTALNGNTYTVGSTTTNTYELDGTDGRSGSYGSPPAGSYTSGGIADCYLFSCKYYTFTNTWGWDQTFTQSTCVTERVGANQYTDAAPSTTYVGRNYPSSTNGCLSNEIVPLSTDKSALHAVAQGLNAQGSTSGQVGLAWAWYMVSPNFGYLWPSASRPAAYGTPNTNKIVVLMTDGSFNSPYCNGVIAADATSGSGSSSDHINCNATNGNAYTQANAQCDAMKDAGIIVYTVGFDIDSQQEAIDLMANCATDSAHAFLADDNAALQEAFQDIGQNIATLRIAQ